MIAFGIDPGSLRTGWGVVAVRGNALSFVAAGTIAMPGGQILAERMHEIFLGLSAVLGEHRPDHVFLESLFHHRNARSALVLGHARGVALLAAHRAACPIGELSPAEVKKAVTGSGRAEKDQVQEMVRILLGMRDRLQADAADALAVAIAGANRLPFQRRLAQARTT